MASAEVTEDNEDTHVKSGFGRVLGMASVFGVSSAGQRTDRPSPIYSRFQLFDRGSSESVETSSARGWAGRWDRRNWDCLALFADILRTEAASVPYRTIHLVKKNRLNL